MQLDHKKISETTKLFQTTAPSKEWCRFEAHGFDNNVSGMIYRTDQPATCGMPVGAIDTGIIGCAPCSQGKLSHGGKTCFFTKL